MNPHQTHNVLWTSGWDSTFRLADLLLVKGKTVQPYYVVDRGRPSTAIEIERMDQISQQLIEKEPTVRTRLLPRIDCEKKQLTKNKEISDSLSSLAQRSYIGSQYGFLARFAFDYGIEQLELSIHKDDKAHGFLKDVIELKSGQGSDISYRIKENSGDKDLLNVFGRFTFPLFEMTKLEMEDYAVKHNYQDVMENTWFCHKPIRNRPCGLCPPCRYTREEGLGRRVPDPSLIDKTEYHLYRMMRKLNSLVKK